LPEAEVAVANAIPLIRAGALAPTHRWLERQGRDATAAFAVHDLPGDAIAAPMRPVGLIAAIRFLAALAAREGPDLPLRLIGAEGIAAVPSLAHAVAGARTSRAVLARVTRSIPGHATHEFFAFEVVPGGMAVRDAFALSLPADALHAVQLYEAVLLYRVLEWTGLEGPLLLRMEMVPHPVHGLAHVARGLGVPVVAAAGRRFAAIIPDRVLDAPLSFAPRVAATDPPPPLIAPDLSHSARLLVREMLFDGEPSLERLMLASGRSRRTLQRQFQSEGTRFKSLLDAVRRDEVLRRLCGDARVTDVAADTGYASPSGLTRAVRRWTAQPSRRLRVGGTG
jgi:AraC-like DNA-binding protein